MAGRRGSRARKFKNMKKTATPTPTQTKRNNWVKLDRSAMNALVNCSRMRQGKKGARPWRRRDLLAVLGDLENHWLAQRGANSVATKILSALPTAGLSIAIPQTRGRPALSRRNCVHHAEYVAFEFGVSHEHRRSGSDVQLQHAQQEA
jgi:hypothetical protein